MNAAEWKNAWDHHLKAYLDSPPRTGSWLNSFLRGNTSKSLLELACGSARDAAYLSSKGYQVTASDFAKESLDAASQRWVSLPLKFVHADAFHLPFKDKSFDYSFHNGLYVYFEDNNALKKLVLEQARVTKEAMIFINHNAYNLKLQQVFASKATHDPVFRIRFFKPPEIEQIVQQSGVPYLHVKHYKFGGIWDALGSRKIKGFRNPLADFFRNKTHFFYPLLKWAHTERIISVVTMRSETY